MIVHFGRWANIWSVLSLRNDLQQKRAKVFLVFSFVAFASQTISNCQKLALVRHAKEFFWKFQKIIIIFKMVKYDENRNVVNESCFDDVFRASINSLCDFTAPQNPPKWLDKKLYMEGRKFFWDHVLIVFLVYCQNLIVGLSVPNLW